MRDKLFNDRTRAMYATAKRRGQPDFTLDELRGDLDHFFRQRPLCRCCNARMSIKDVSLDHRLPVARGGSNSLRNVAYVCKGCNKAKGDMTEEEFRDLLKTLDEWGARHRNPALRDKVLTTLKVGNSFRFGANRRAKKG